MKKKRTTKKKPAAGTAIADDIDRWPASKVEIREVSELIPYAWNARRHSSEQVEQIVASIREWGWTVPVLIDEKGEIIAGHGRVLAAERLGLDRVPAMVARGWTAEQRRAYRIADNNLALNSTWDDGLLKFELEDLKGVGFEIGLLGFSTDRVGSLLEAPGALGQDEAAPDPPEVATSRHGDVWLLGRHRLACGDSTSRDTVSEALRGARPMLMVTDPPYGVEYAPAWREDLGVGRTGKVANDNRSDWTAAFRLFPGDVAYVWHAPTFGPASISSLERCGFAARGQIVWAKPRFAISRGNYHWQHEGCAYAVKPDELPADPAEKDELILRLSGLIAAEEWTADHEQAWYAIRSEAKARWAGSRRQSSLWEIPLFDGGDQTKHGTQKPLECMARPIRNHAIDEVFDPFVGSGTTVIACELLGRTCYAVELDPSYVDVTVERWQRQTGEEAILEETGEAFSVVKKARS